MFCYRDYQLTTRFNQQNEKSTSNFHKVDDEQQEIQWQYIEDVNILQEDIGFTFANKLKCKHIMWTKHKMNVSMAAQTLSHSVASAIDFL